jgi:hypothetical protein
MPNLAWIRKGYHGYSVCTTDNAASARVNTKFLQVFYIDHKMKLHEKRYNDIHRLSFSVTACIGIQLHLSKFRKNSEKQGYM